MIMMCLGCAVLAAWFGDTCPADAARSEPARSSSACRRYRCNPWRALAVGLPHVEHCARDPLAVEIGHQAGLSWG